MFPQVNPGYGLEKNLLFSIIASSISTLPGHRSRNRFIEKLLLENPSLKNHAFGRGRIPLERKEEGLDPYMFSLAIENSQIPSYVTEKFIDCLLRETVPVYFGAPNIAQNIDHRAFVALPDISNKSAAELMGSLSPQLYSRMKPYVIEAKEKYLSSDRLCCYLIQHVEENPAASMRRIILRPGLGELRRRVGSVFSKLHLGSTSKNLA